MFRFASPNYLYLLLLVVAMGIVYFFLRKRYYKQLSLFGDLEVIKPLMSEASWQKVTWKYMLTLFALALLVLVLARPQIGSKLHEVKKRGIEVMLVVDVSNSMMAEDFTPSRLERTKFAINQLMDKFSDDRVGLVVFAGDAYVQLPVTSDFVSAKNFVNHISPGMVSVQGTSIGKALTVADRSFSSQSEGSRLIILVSDGENHEGNPLEVAKQIGERGVIISAIGIGTPEGAPITINGEIMKDENGQMVVSKLNEEMLKEIAVSSGGAYIRANNKSMGFDEIIAQARGLEQQNFASNVFEEYNEQFQYIIAIVLLVLLVEFVILERKNRIIARMRLFNKEEKKRDA